MTDYLPLSSPQAPKSLHVLIVEDSEDDAALLLAELRRGGYVVTWSRVDNARDLVAQLAIGHWDLVISDHNLPQFNAPEALRLVRERAGDLPFIIVSGSIGEAQAVAGMRAGANDYLLKGQLARLGPVVERELAEAAQRRKREEAEQALRHTEEQLRQAQKMEAVGRLAGGIAHDFNNLLTAIIGYSELLLSEIPKTAPLREDIEEIRKAGGRAAGLTQQLLAFSRHQVLEPRVVNLNEIISNVEKLLGRLIGEDIEVRIDLDSELQPVRVDPGQIEQVLMNLAINSRDAMPDGGRLAIRTRSTLTRPNSPDAMNLPPGPYAVMTVADAGTGIPPEIIEQIFEPFFTTKGPGKGTGLGLSTVYGIVKQSGGTILVESALGRGTEFSIYLPCIEAELQDTQPLVDTPVSIEGSETILVVDDDTTVRELVRKALEPHGYLILSAENGLDALRTLNSNQPVVDLLITDVIMPHMGGRELVTRVAEKRGLVPVLFLSGYPDSSEFGANIPPNAQAFLRKPFTPGALTQKVRQLLNRASGRAPENFWA
jgi:signal transduction histidine kinase